MTLRRGLLVAAVAATVLTLAACSTTTTPATTVPGTTTTSTVPDANTTVTISGFAFNPGTLTVTVGTTVTWVNSDGTNHTVTADDGSFDSGQLANGATFQFTFDQVGDFAYHCSIHSTMHGIISVKGRA